MMNKKLWQMLFIICFGMMSSQLWAQNTAPRSKANLEMAPALNSSRQIDQTNPNQVKSETKARAEKAQMEKKLKSLKVSPKDEMTLIALKEEMDANVNNPSYDMDHSFKLFSTSPLVIYPFDHYDPAFPLVIRTGDKEQDARNYNLAKAEWKENRKALKGTKEAVKN